MNETPTEPKLDKARFDDIWSRRATGLWTAQDLDDLLVLYPIFHAVEPTPPPEAAGETPQLIHNILADVRSGELGHNMAVRLVMEHITATRAKCSCCAGSGVPVSGLKCVCGGAGTQEAELQGFREDRLGLTSKLEELTKERDAKIPTHLLEQSEAWQAVWAALKALPQFREAECNPERGMDRAVRTINLLAAQLTAKTLEAEGLRGDKEISDAQIIVARMVLRECDTVFESVSRKGPGLLAHDEYYCPSCAQHAADSDHIQHTEVCEIRIMRAKTSAGLAALSVAGAAVTTQPPAPDGNIFEGNFTQNP